MKAVYGTGLDREDSGRGSGQPQDCLCVTCHKSWIKPTKACRACGGTGKRQPLKVKGSD